MKPAYPASIQDQDYFLYVLYQYNSTLLHYLKDVGP